MHVSSTPKVAVAQETDIAVAMGGSLFQINRTGIAIASYKA